MIERLRCFVLILVVVTAVPALAQSPQPRAEESARAAGPRVERTATGVRQLTKADTGDVALAAKRQQMGKPVALMIVGGAAIILGAVIGGDAGALFMIGGAVIGLIGLYQYLQ